MEGQVRARHARRPRFPQRRPRRRDRVETTGAPAAIRLTPDRVQLRADGEDLAAVTVAVVGRRGRIVPPAASPSPSPSAAPAASSASATESRLHEPDVFVGSSAARVRPIDGWRWKKIADPYADTIAEAAPGLNVSSGKRPTSAGKSGPLGSRERGLFRATFTVAAADLAAKGGRSRFGKIDGDGRVFVNGKRIRSRRSSRSFPLKSDKAQMEVPSPAAGKITQFVVKVGDKVSMGSVIAKLDAGGSAAAIPSDQEDEAEAKEEEDAAEAPETSPVAPREICRHGQPRAPRPGHCRFLGRIRRPRGSPAGPGTRP